MCNLQCCSSLVGSLPTGTRDSFHSVTVAIPTDAQWCVKMSNPATPTPHVSYMLMVKKEENEWRRRRAQVLHCVWFNTGNWLMKNKGNNQSYQQTAPFLVIQSSHCSFRFTLLQTLHISIITVISLIESILAFCSGQTECVLEICFVLWFLSSK